MIGPENVRRIIGSFDGGCPITISRNAYLLPTDYWRPVWTKEVTP